MAEMDCGGRDLHWGECRHADGGRPGRRTAGQDARHRRGELRAGNCLQLHIQTAQHDHATASQHSLAIGALVSCRGWDANSCAACDRKKGRLTLSGGRDMA